MGELKIDEPVVLKAHDEVNYAWNAIVTPGTEYTFSVASVRSGEGYYYGHIYILDEGTDLYDDENLIAMGESFSPTVSFIAPKDGTVSIMISMVNWINTDIEVTLTQNDTD